MRLRSLLGLAAIVASFAVVAIACDSSSDSGSSAGFDAGGQGELDAASQPDTSSRDSSTAPDASTADAADAADSAVAVTVLPFSTGLDVARVALDDKSVDTHWTVKDANGVALTSYAQTDALDYEGYWMVPSATSKFISPFLDTVDPSDSGTFTYTTTFAVGADVDLGTATLTAKYASDNSMTAITINGAPLADVVAGNYSTFETRTIRNLVHGTNTISFSVKNESGPTGFRAELLLDVGG